jgi:glycosyltransferase involved in cell wall biosynthesis
VTAVIPATKRPETLERVRGAIEEAAAPPEEILVVDGPPQAGPAEARNAGARRASGDVLVFVDADVLVHRDAFVRIRAAFESDPALSGVFGSYDDEPAQEGTVSAFRNLLHHHVHHNSAGPAKTFWAGLGAIRRDVFLGTGGFDEAYRVPSIEDVELGLRLTDAGHRLELAPEIQGKHLKRWTLPEMIRCDVRQRAVPWLTLLLRRRHLPAALNLSWGHRASALASVGLAGAVATRRSRALIPAATLLIVLNRAFYRLLWEKLGPRKAALGVGLHVVHHLSAVAASPLALWVYLRARHAGS